METSELKNVLLKNMNEIEAIFNNKTLTVGEQYSSCYTLFSDIQEKFLQLDEEQKQWCIDYLEKSVATEDAFCYIYKISFLLKIAKKVKYLHEIYQYAENTNLTLQSRVFLYWQITSIGFLLPQISDSTSGMRYRKLHKSILAEYEKALPESPKWIPATERNKNIVIVMTNQILGIAHGPTQTALDRCHTLQAMGKNVFLINTAEMPKQLYLPFYEGAVFNFIEEYSSINSFEYLGKDVPFYQCREEMPNITEMTRIVNLIAEMKPDFILSVGGNNFTSDLCSKIVPVLTQGCVNGLPTTEGQFYLMWREPHESELSVLEQLDIERERIIESHFTFRIRPQEKQLTRERFEIPKNKFVLAVVGGRLDHEVTTEFTNELADFLERNPQVLIAFAGAFSRYETWKDSYPCLEKQTRYLGFQDDILAFYDLCDAYLNPPRTGGGTSAVEAMYKGMHVFTYPIGDVSHDAGLYYHITSFNDVEDFIKKWYADEEFRKMEKKMAMERAAELTDTDKAMKKIISEVEKSRYYL
jgi:UDP-N-acetylglucosamine:LPS N-acetylglucosamine transferase